MEVGLEAVLAVWSRIFTADFVIKRGSF